MRENPMAEREPAGDRGLGFAQTQGKREIGQTAVEFALMLIVLVTVTMAIIELGRLLQVWLTVQNSAQTATRYAVTGQEAADPSDDPWDRTRLQAIKDEARRVAGSLAIDDSAGKTEAGFFEVTISAADRPPTTTIGAEFPGGPNQRVAIRVTYNHDLITPFLREVYPSLRMTARSEMINERFRHPGYGRAPGVLPPEIPLIVSGYVSTADSQAITGVTIGGLPHSPIVTDPDGYYLDEVPAGWDGTVTASKTGCSFDPNSRTYTDVASDHLSEDYIGTCP
jgi:Flp pilus assembly protein TadG